MHYLDIALNGIDKNGERKVFKLSDFKKHNIVLYFYPQDDTPVCTQEAEMFRDAIKELENFATVIGVNNNDIDSHINFQKMYKLNFILLSDEKEELKNSIISHLKDIQNINRTTFILNKDGNIEKFWEKVDIDGHTNEIINFFKSKNNC